MMMAVGFPEVMASLGGAMIVVFGVCVICWAGYCITSIARAANALERKADERREGRECDISPLDKVAKNML